MSQDNFTNLFFFLNHLRVLRNILSRNECQLVRLNMMGNALGDNGLQILCCGVEVRSCVRTLIPSDPESSCGILYKFILL